jgi:hypothetical protein
VTAGTLFWARLKFRVTLDALAVEGVATADHLAAFDLIRIVTFKTTGWEGFAFGRCLVAVTASAQGFSFVAGVVMAIHTGGTVTAGRRVGVVVKEDFPCHRLVHQSDGCFRGCLGKGGVTDDGNEQQMNSETIGDQQLSLGSHWHNP